MAELETIAAFLGKKVSLGRLDVLAVSVDECSPAEPNCREYVIELPFPVVRALDDEDDPDLNFNTNFKIELSIEGETLINARIRKYIFLPAQNGIATGYETSPNYAEIEVVRLVLTLLTIQDL